VNSKQLIRCQAFEQDDGICRVGQGGDFVTLVFGRLAVSRPGEHPREEIA